MSFYYSIVNKNSRIEHYETNLITTDYLKKFDYQIIYEINNFYLVKSKYIYIILNDKIFTNKELPEDIHTAIQLIEIK